MADGTHIVSHECARMRQLAREGHTNAKLARRFDTSDATVMRHLKGGCSHEIGEPPIESDRRGGTGRNPSVTAEQCAKWRRRVEQQDRTFYEIAKGEDYDRGTVKYHVDGECLHDEDEI